MNTSIRTGNLLLAGMIACGIMLSLSGGAVAQAANHGYSWTQVTAAAPWPARAGHAAVSFKGKMWVLGGGGIQGMFNDVWSSSDGSSWTLVTSAAPWSPRLGGGAIVVFGDKLWVVSRSQFVSDIWSSPDGLNWTKEVADAPWGLRAPRVAVFKDKMWVFGGYDYGTFTTLNDVWNSPDGRNWTQVAAHASWSPRSVFGTVFKGKLWLLGGYSVYPNVECELWPHDACESSDGLSWSHIPSIGVGSTCAVVEFDGALWDMDRSYWYSCYTMQIHVSKEVWRSEDGGTWQQMQNAPWSPRLFQASVAYDGKLWLTGGEYSDGNALNDVWCLTPVSLGIDAGQRYQYGLGDGMTLKLTAEGLVGPVSYQWSKDGTAIAGATTDTYQVDRMTGDDAGVYTCALTGGTFGTAGPAQIQVIMPKVPASSPVGLVLGVALGMTVLFLRKRILPSRRR